MKAAKATSLTLPPRLMREVERVAKREGRTRNELLSDAVKKYIADSNRRELLRYGQEQARKLGLKESDVDRLIHEFRSGR
jgi:metal-responsive CopG/Arc/MetJ family transcriptional regulator